MSKSIWKFGYGSNLSPEFARTKKNLNVLDYRRCILKGFALSFPLGRGLDLVEPTFATLRRDPESCVHGTCLLLPKEDCEKLDAQERSYAVEQHRFEIYREDEAVEGEHFIVGEVYAPKSSEPEGSPQGACSNRYKNIMVNAAKSVQLAPEWIEKLENLPFYVPTAETLEQRKELPIYEPKSGLKEFTIAELKRHDGTDDSLPVLIGFAGYVFESKPFFKIYWGRDYTFRITLHYRGISMDTNDDGGKNPFPKLKDMDAELLEYVLQNRDRNQKIGKVVGVLKEFWDDQ